MERRVEEQVKNIIAELKGDIFHSNFIPWIKIKDVCISRNESIERTRIYYINWCQTILDLTRDTPYGGIPRDCNWYKQNDYNATYSSEFRFLSKLNNDREQRFISSLRIFPNKSIVNLNDFHTPIVCEWGLITINNLMLSFISHKHYVSPPSIRKSRSYEEEAAIAAYQIKNLLKKSDTIYSNRLINKYLLCNPEVISEYIKIETL